PAAPEQMTVYPAYAWSDPEPEQSSLRLSDYLWFLSRFKWRILAFVLFAVAATIVVSSRLTPIYEATASVAIDRQLPAGVTGQEAARMAPNDADQFLATQIRIIQSDSVLRPVAQRFKIPVVERNPLQSRLPSSRAQNAPVVLPNLNVTRPPNTYLFQISYRSPDADVAADVANAIAESYIQHTYNIR